jgi:Flp pilus assembly protein CpaB
LATIPRATQRSDGVPESPTAGRLAPPKWRDGRFVFGVVLVLVAVLFGARLVSGQRSTASVLVAARPLSSGHTLEAGDVRAESLRLSGVTGRYWPGADAAGLVGHRLVSAVGAGDLVPRSAVASTSSPVPYRVVSLPVDPARLPSLASGDRVDIFATYKATQDAAGETVAVLRGAEYVGGGDSGSGTQVAIRLRVPVSDAAAVIRASQVAAIDIALQEPAGNQTGDVGSAPVTDPAGADLSGKDTGTATMGTGTGQGTGQGTGAGTSATTGSASLGGLARSGAVR